MRKLFPLLVALLAVATIDAQTIDCTHNVWASLEACGWPGPSNTGPDLTQCTGGTLTNVTGPVNVTAANSTISCQNITGGVNVRAQNVTIKNSIVSYNAGGGLAASGTGVININDGGSATIDHVELNGLDGTHACIWDEGVKGSTLAYSVVAKNVKCHDTNDGFWNWWWASDTHAGAGSDFIYQDSYLYNFTEDASNGHIDGYQTEGTTNGQITHNTFYMVRRPGDVDISGGNLDSSIAIWDDWNQGSNPTGLVTNNIVVSNNLLSGGGFTAYAEDYSGPNGIAAENVPNSNVGGDSMTNIQFLNNKFSTHVGGACVGQWGTWFYRGAWSPYYGGPTDLWNQGGSFRAGNVVLETGENIDTGGPTGCEGHNTSPAPIQPPTGLTATVN
jgi:hypothetical protein